MENEGRIQTVCLLVLAAIAVAAALYFLRSLMVPFVLSLFFAFMLMPFIDLQTRYLKFPRLLAVAVTLLVAVLIIVSLSLLMSVSVHQMATVAGSYQEQVKDVVVKTTASLPFERFGLDKDQFLGPIRENLGKNIGSMIGWVLNAIVNLFSNIVLILIFLVFLLIRDTKKPTYRNKVWERGEAKVKRYISSKLILSAVLGLCVGATLSLLGVEPAVVFGLFAGILNFIPTVGPVIATILPLPVILMTPEMTIARGLLALAVPGLLQFVFGNFIETKVMGESLDLHPVTILMSLIFWGMLWGPAGMFLAVPITAVLKMILEEIELTRPIADILAGRPT